MWPLVSAVQYLLLEHYTLGPSRGVSRRAALDYSIINILSIYTIEYITWTFDPDYKYFSHLAYNTAVK